MNYDTFSQLQGAQILDVRLSEDFDQAHIQNAVNNCVFEVTFTDRLKDTAPDLQSPTVIYGASDTSLEAQMAYEKLERLGYTDLHLLQGGIQTAPESLLVNHTQTAGSPPEIAPLEGIHNIDLEESNVEWVGRNLLNKHWGTIGLKSGHLEFSKDTLIGGEFILDLNRLECTDLANTEMHDILIHHLHDHDFFDVEQHPLAHFKITQVNQVTGTSAGSHNLEITGDLSLRGQTHSITFYAAAGRTPDGHAAAQATLSFDRTRWGILYGSGKFFHRLAGHLVNDFIDLQIRIITQNSN